VSDLDAPGPTLAQIVEIAERSFGALTSPLLKSNAVVQTVVVISDIPGPWDQDGTAERVRAAEREVMGEI